MTTRLNNAAACLVVGATLTVVLDGWWLLIPLAFGLIGLWLTRDLM